MYTPGVPSLLTKPRREYGAVLVTDPETGTQDFMTLMCVHCNRHWRYVPGSGRERGFCLRCMGPTCGRRRCDECIPVEKWCEMVEAQARMERNLAVLRR